MPAPTEQKIADASEIQVSMPRVVKFIRQLAHDLRNHLNAAELQSAYLTEIAEDGELKDEIKRLRGMISQVGTSLQELTAALGQPRLTEMPYDAAEFLEDLQQKVAADHPDESTSVQWDTAAAKGTLNIDPQLLLPALLELFTNAFRHGRAEGSISATARISDGEFVFTLSEPKADFEGAPEEWGHQPFQSLGQGHYGLGLHRTRNVVEAHRGRYEARYDKGGSLLVTTITLPLAATDE
jgi:K+-sensing histidine kinase KdpD